MHLPHVEIRIMDVGVSLSDYLFQFYFLLAVWIRANYLTSEALKWGF